MKTKPSSHIKNIRFALILSYSCILIAALIAAFLMMYSQMTSSKDKNISSLTSFSSSTLKERIVDFFDSTERDCEIFFRYKKLVDFYPTEDMSSADVIKMQDDISETLLSISLNDFYADFGIAYSDGSSAGIITDSTKDVFGSELYSGLASFLNEDTNDGWGTGYNGNYEKLYFVKRLNDNAVMTVSSYSKELERRMKDVVGFSEATTAVINEDGVIICCADSEKSSMIGESVDNEPLSMIIGKKNITVQNESYYVSTDEITSGFRSICIVPKAGFISQRKSLITVFIVICISATVLSVLVCVYITRQLSVSALTQLYTGGQTGVDRLTQLVNKFSTEDMVIDKLESSPVGSCYGLVLCDIDNLKDINDKISRAAGDETIVTVSSLIRSVFGEDAVIGRLGGDKFEILADVTDYDLFKAANTLEQKCAELCESLKNSYADEERTFPIAVSVGAALYPLSSDTYEGLLYNADEALRNSKQKGGGCFTVYRRSENRKGGS